MGSQLKAWDKLYKNNLIWHRDTKSLPKILKGKKVIELGVGTGKTLRAILKQKPKSVLAIDFSENAINKCKLEFSDKNLILRKGDILTIPIEENSFDVIVCYYILNNLTSTEMKRLVKRLDFALKQSGIILFEDFAQGDLRQKERKDKIICHFFNEKEVNNLFSGFTISNLKVKSFNPIKSKSNLERKIISAIIKK